jgi:hypothetical protein
MAESFFHGRSTDAGGCDWILLHSPRGSKQVPELAVHQCGSA